MIFEVLIKSKLLERLDLTDNFGQRFNVQNKKLKKQVDLYEIEKIDNINILTLAINSKEYFEMNRDYSINKKHKGVNKNTPRMDFEAYSERLATLHEYCSDRDHKPKKVEQK